MSNPLMRRLGSSGLAVSAAGLGCNNLGRAGTVTAELGPSRAVVDAAIDAGVRRVVALSTDKAVNPVNLYGATKLCAEKIFVQGNAYAAQAVNDSAEDQSAATQEIATAATTVVGTADQLMRLVKGFRV